MARADCRGPYVLNGRSVTTGRSKLRKYDSASLSAAILLAEYGDWAWSGCSSVIGVNWAVPETSLVEVTISLRTCSRRQASSTLSVPIALTATYDVGAW